MFDASAPVYDYWMEQIHVMAGRTVQLPGPVQLYGPAYVLTGEVAGAARTHPFREAFDQRRRDFKRKWVSAD
ncbi:MAG: hypothetical protein JWO33_1265 [Caulobacteraceae bacterium]|nr:hypothetical protein [Caulobacteraceae bacterium]